MTTPPLRPIVEPVRAAADVALCSGRFGFTFLIYGVLASSLLATAPRFSGTLPAGAQRGTELEVRFSGDRLQDAQELVFYAPGIELVKFESVGTNRIKALLRIAPDCRLGEHHVRVRAAGGVSELQTFYVGPFPSVDENEPNNTPQKAQIIPLNVTLAGAITSEDVDCYSITAKQGQRLSAEVEGMRLGREAFDAIISLYDDQGSELASSDDSALLQQDGLFSVIAPKDGTYVLKIREVSYGGNANFIYRLHVGSFPRPTAIYPAGGASGERLQVRFLGDATGEFTQTIDLPKMPSDKFGVFAQQDELSAPSPNWMRVSSFPNVLEAEPNNLKEQATASSAGLPLAFNGILSVKGDVDCFRFTAKQGQALDLQLYARRLRSPLDSVLEVCDGNGKSIASNDDAAGADSNLKFNPPADGEYLLRVRDQLKKGGPDFVYRLEVTPVAPSISLSIPQVARNDAQTRQYIVVPQGNRFATVISAKRANVNGELQFKIDGLPQGVSLHSDTMSAKVDAIPLVFEAQSDAPVSGKLLDLVASTTNGVQGHFVHKVEMVRGPNNSSYYDTSVDKLYVAVTEPAPFHLRIVEPKVPLVQYGTMDLKVETERAPGFDEPINVKMLWNPPGIGSLPDITIPKGQNSVVYQINAKGDAPTEVRKIAVLGSATVNGGTVWVSSQLARLEVADPYVLAKIETASGEPGQKAKIVCKLEQKIPFEGKAGIRLVGLSDKVKVSDMEISKDDEQVVFDLTIDPKCPTGSQRSLFCNVIVKKNGEEISHNVGSGGVFRVVPPKNNTKVASAGK